MDYEQMKRVHSMASKLLARKSLMTPEEVADVLGVTKATVLRWARNGTLPAIRIRNVVKFDSGNLARWLVARGDKSEVVPALNEKVKW